MKHRAVSFRLGLLALAITLAWLAAPHAARAAGNDILLSGSLSDTTFTTLIKDMGSAIAYRPVSPAEPRGLTGFDLGVSVTMVNIDDSVWNLAVQDGKAPSALPVPRLHLQKGLPWGIDLGVSYTAVPGSDIKVVGGEVKKALIEGATLWPAVAVTLHGSRMSGTSELDLSTYGVDLGISKGLAMFTPYAAVGEVWIQGKEKSALVNLNNVNTNITRVYGGLKIAFLPFMNLDLEAGKGESFDYTARLNVGF